MTPRTDELSDEQQAVATADPEDRLIVNAGAGTGKTHTLVSRMEYLATHCDYNPVSDLLVLSFSRAAVGELRRRRADRRERIPYVPVRTLDSFVTEILEAAEPDGSWMTKGYDGRIRLALERLSSDDAWPRRPWPRHILVDEAQDLVGVRSDFVVEVLRKTRCAFTVLGDAAQAIYGFADDRLQSTTASVPFMERVAGLEPDRPIRELALTRQMRARSDDARAVMRFGTRTDGVRPEQVTAHAELVELVEQLPRLDGLGGAARMLRRSTRSTGVLTRTRAQALVAAEELRRVGVEPWVRPVAHDRAVGPWLAFMVQEGASRVLDPESVGDLPPHLVPSSKVLPDVRRALRSIDPGNRRGVEIGRINSKLRMGATPDDLAYQSDASVVVSTIHRAKGLEFDRVIVCPFNSERGDPAEEDRVLYVGLSRSADEIYVLPGLKTGGLHVDRRAGRVIEGGYGRSRATAMEVMGHDCDDSVPPGALRPGSDCPTIQRYLLETVMPEDALVMKLCTVGSGRDAQAAYELLHEGQPVGHTSADFVRVLRAVTGNRAGALPQSIVGTRVQFVETVAGDGSITETAGLGTSGMWARVRPMGLGRFVESEEVAGG